MKRIHFLAVFILLIGQFSFSQKPVTLQQAIDTALQNNLLVKNERLKAEYQQKLLKTGANVPNTMVTGGFGQINSFYVDKSIGLSQSINFPTVYAKQKKLLNEEWKGSVLLVGVQEAQLKMQVTQLFNSILYLENKKKLLQQNDSIFSTFQNFAAVRYSKGESNVLEKTTAENQRGQIMLQLQQLEQDLDLSKLEFQLLLNSKLTLFPVQARDQNKQITVMDTSALRYHPSMQYFEQQEQIAAAQTKAEQSKLLPDLMFSYQVMSMRGAGADNLTYDGGLRFQSGQIGIGIPVFSGSQRSKINAAKANELIAQNSYNSNLQAFELQYYSAFVKYQKYVETVSYFENVALNYSETIRTTANLQLKNGDINYLDWVQLINQSTTIESDYIEAVKNRDNALAELNFYTNN